MHDFRLTISSEPEDAAYRVALSRPPDEELASTRLSDLDAAALHTEYTRLLGAYPNKQVSSERLADFGQRLADVLLPPQIRSELLARLRTAPDPTTPVRLRLKVTARELNRLPWEFAFVKAQPPVIEPGDFLCLHPRFHLVRLVGEVAPPQPIPADPPRVLIAWADPASKPYPRLLHLQEEVNAIEVALSNSECRRIKVEVLPGATHAGLQRCLAERRPQVLHFLGHGNVSPTGGMLILESGRSGKEDAIYAKELAEWLTEAEVRLVVLSACHSASPVGGVAQELSARGIAAVVGMQLPMRTATSAQFARAFYGSLAQPTAVEEALGQARQILGTADADFGVPVLYLSTDSSDIFVLPPVPKPRPAFTNLPYPHDPNFVGREDELTQLHRYLQSPDRPVAIVGLGGLGKTQLVSEYAHAYRREYPGGVFWINARDRLRIMDDYAAISRFFDVPETLSTEERARRMLDRLQELKQPALIILDNITEDTDLALLPEIGACRILATAREEYLVRLAFQILLLSGLKEEAALMLLRTGRRATSDEEETAARDIAALLGYLPLALALVSNHVRRLGTSFGEYRTRLKAGPEEMLGRARTRFLTTTKHDGSIFDAISLSHRGLSQLARNVLAAAACFASKGIPPDLLFAACDRAGFDPGSQIATSPDDYAESLAELVDYCLVTRQEDGRLSVHELVRVFARGQMDAADRRKVLESIACVLTNQLARGNEALDWRAVQPELVHCRHAADLCRTYEVYHELYRLLRELGIYHSEQFEVRTALEYLQEGLYIVQNVLGYGRQHPETARFLRLIGAEKLASDEAVDALQTVKEALEIALALYGPDASETAPFYNEVGLTLKMQGSLDDALPYYLKALENTEHAFGRLHAAVAKYINNIGLLFEAQGKLEEAREWVEEAIRIRCQVLGERHPDNAIDLNNRGRILRQQGRGQESLECHQAALDIYLTVHEERRHRDIAWTRYYLAEAYRALRQLEDAKREYSSALALFSEIYGEQHAKCIEIDAKLRELDDMEAE